MHFNNINKKGETNCLWPLLFLVFIGFYALEVRLRICAPCVPLAFTAAFVAHQPVRSDLPCKHSSSVLLAE